MRPFVSSPRTIVAALCLATLVSCDGTVDTITVAPGAPVVQNRAVGNFTKLAASHGFEVTITPDSVNEVRIEAPEGYQPYITAVVENDQLRITVDEKLDDDESLPRRAMLRVRTLHDISLSGGCRVTATDTLRTTFLSLLASGGSTLTLPVAADVIDCQMSGGSSLTLSGRDSVLITDYSGGSTLHAFNLLSKLALVHVSGGSTMEVRTTEGVDVEGSGGSKVYYHGPLRTTKLSGGAEVIDRN